MALALDTVKLAVKKGFDEAVASFQTGMRSYLKITNSKIDSIVNKFGEEGSLFVSSKNRVFFTNIQTHSRKSVEGAVSTAKNSMQFLVPKSDYYGIAQGPFKHAKPGAHDKDIENYTTDTISGIASACIDTAIASGAANVAGTVFMRYAQTSMATSKGVEEDWKSTSMRISLRLFNRITSVQNEVVASSIKDSHPEKFVKSCASLISQIGRTGRIEEGTYDIIYLPSPGGSLIAQIDSMATMGNVETGSLFTKKLGRQVANKKVSLYDDGNARHSVDACPFDSEGYPTQRTAVIKDGTLQNYLHNFSTAKKYKTSSTGNAGLVNPSANTPVFEHKKRVKDLDALISKVEKGIVITNTWYTRYANYLTGDFSTVPRDLAVYVEKGEPKFAIRQRDVSSMVGIRISDNLIRMLKNTECAADDTVQTTSWDVDNECYFMPSILVRDAKVTVA